MNGEMELPDLEGQLEDMQVQQLGRTTLQAEGTAEAKAWEPG